MEHKVKEIMKNNEKYIVCSKCNALNWYENKKCHNCNSELRGEKITKEQAFNLYQNIVNRGKSEDTKIEV